MKEQAVTIAKLLSLHGVNPINRQTTRAPIIDIEEDLTIRHHLKCDHCDFETDNNSQLNLHKSGKHSDQPDTAQLNMAHCAMCSFCNTSQDSVMKHIEDHHPETFTCNKCDHGFKSKEELNIHIGNIHKEANPNPAFGHSQHNFDCDKCNNEFTSEVNLNKHVTQMHVSKAKVKNTLLLGDSNTKYQNPRIIEKALGGRGLFTPGSVKPRTGRAYCSSKDWPNSRFPNNNLEDKVMEHLATREHSHLIFGAPCNDISNIGDIQDISEKHRLAIKSSENCIKIAEKALREFPKLEKVVIPERLPRADHLSDQSEYSNFALRSLAEKSKLSRRIVVTPMESLYFTTEEEMYKIFGSSRTGTFYGIHPKVKSGPQLYNKCHISAVRRAGISTSNMFEGLN